MLEYECNTLSDKPRSQITFNTPAVQSPEDTTNTGEDNGYEFIDFDSETGDITSTGSIDVSPESFLRKINDLPPLGSMPYRRLPTTKKKIFSKANQEYQLVKDSGESIVTEIDSKRELNCPYVVLETAATSESNPSLTIYKLQVVDNKVAHSVLHTAAAEEFINTLDPTPDQTPSASPHTDPDLRDEDFIAEDFDGVLSIHTDTSWILRQDMIPRVSDLTHSHENVSDNIQTAEKETNFFDALERIAVELKMPDFLSKEMKMT